MQENKPLTVRIKDSITKTQVAQTWHKVAGCKDDREKKVVRKPRV